MQTSQRIGDRKFDALLQTIAQIIGEPLALDLGFNARQQFVPVDGTHQVVVDAHVHTAQQASFVAGLHENNDRQMAGPVKRAHLRTKPQPIGICETETDDQQVKVVFGKL